MSIFGTLLASVDAVERYRIEDGDRHPGITLAKNLSNIMINWGLKKLHEAEAANASQPAPVAAFPPY